MPEPLEPGHLPEGQQPKLSWVEASKIAQASFEEIERRRVESVEREAALTPCCCDHSDVAARVRADVADAITADLQAARRAAASPASTESLDRALRIVARHAVAPAESVVGAPTDTQRCRVVDPRYGQCDELHDGHPEDDRHRTGSLRWPSPVGTLPEAVSDLAAPRDALTDQDFETLRADAGSARDDGAGVERAAQALRARLGTVDAFEDPVKAMAERQVARDLAKIAIDAYRALPVDEGTRQEGRDA